MTGTSARVVFIGADGLRAAAGTRLGPTRPRLVDQESVNRFAEVTDDRQWIHVDEERARDSPFGGTIAHGFLTLSLCSAVLDELQHTTGFAHALNYGLDRVRFPAPVPVGSSVTGTAELAEVVDVPGGVQAAWQVEISVVGATRPSCAARMLSRYLS